MNLFQEDLTDKTDIEIAEWLRQVRQPERIGNQNDKEMLIEHIQKWDEHYKKYKKTLYDSKAFKRAVIILALEKTIFKEIEITIKGKKGKKKRYKMSYEEVVDFGIMKMSQVETLKSEKAISYEGKLANVYNELLKCDWYSLREIINEIIEDHKVHECIEIKFIGSADIASIKTLEELKACLENEEDGYKINALATTECSKKEILERMNEAHLAKQTYYNYRNGQNYISKEFLINLAYFLALDSELLEGIMKGEGYTLEESKKEEDQIAIKCISLGAGREFMERLLKENKCMSMNKREFSNRLPKLAFVLYYLQQEYDERQRLKRVYDKGLKDIEEKITALFEKEVNKYQRLNSRYQKSMKNIEKINKQIEPLFEKVDYDQGIDIEVKKEILRMKYLYTSEVEYEMAQTILLAYGVFDRKILKDWNDHLSESEKGLCRNLVKQDKKLNISRKDIENTLRELEKKSYEVKDIFPHYIAKEENGANSKDKERMVYINEIEKFKMTFSQIEKYVGLENKEDKEKFVIKLLQLSNIEIGNKNKGRF